MSPAKHISDAAAAGYQGAIDNVFTGVRCLQFKATCFAQGDVEWVCTLWAPLEVLVQHGLVDQATVDSLPKSGAGERGGLYLRRGKAAVTIDAHFGPDTDRPAGKGPLHRLEARILAAILPRTWSPPKRVSP